MVKSAVALYALRCCATHTPSPLPQRRHASVQRNHSVKSTTLRSPAGRGEAHGTPACPVPRVSSPDPLCHARAVLMVDVCALCPPDGWGSRTFGAACRLGAFSCRLVSTATPLSLVGLGRPGCGSRRLAPGLDAQCHGRLPFEAGDLMQADDGHYGVERRSFPG